MSDIVQDTGRVWHRLFDHKGFLSGEINFTLREFEQKRSDREVDNLFNVIENITDIKDTQIDRLRQVINECLPEANKDLDEALELCTRFADLENKYKEDNTIEEARSLRKVTWDKFMDNITTTYSEINNTFEIREEELKKTYEDLEKKLHT